MANKENKLPDHATTVHAPGIPILPGRNTPLVQEGPPKNVQQLSATVTQSPKSTPSDK